MQGAEKNSPRSIWVICKREILGIRNLWLIQTENRFTVHLLVKMFLAAPIVLADAIAVGINVRGWQITRS
jgi:hypothetical protein